MYSGPELAGEHDGTLGFTLRGHPEAYTDLEVELQNPTLHQRAGIPTPWIRILEL